MKTNDILKIASLTRQANALSRKSAEIRQKLAKLTTHSSTTAFSNGAMLVTVSLADYLAIFPTVEPTLYKWPEPESSKQFGRLEYPKKFIGRDSKGEVYIDAHSPRFEITSEKETV